MRYIYETSQAEGEVQRRLQELVEYMKWRSRETLDAYEHYFDAARHAETLDVLHERMHQELERWKDAPAAHSSRREPGRPRHTDGEASSLAPDEPDLDFLYQLGGSL